MPPPKLPPRVRIRNGAYHYSYDTDDINPANGRRKQKSVKLCRVADGESKMHERLGEIIGGPSLLVGNLPERLKAFQAEYLPELTFKTRKEYTRIYDIIATVFERFDTEQVRAPDIKDFVRAKFTTPRMQRDARSRISTFMSWCVLYGYAETNPCAYVPIKQPPPKRYEWTAQKWHAIRDALLIDKNGQPTATGEMMQCYMDLCFLLYQRNTEERLLRLTQIDRAAGVIRFTPKKTERTSGASVSVPITPAIAAVLDRAASIRKSYGDNVVMGYVICKRDGTPYTATGLRGAWDRACKRAGVTGLTSKSIRAYAATEASRTGYTKEQIQKGLAHRLITTTEGYVAKHEEQRSALALSLPEFTKTAAAIGQK